MTESHPQNRIIGYARVSTYGQTLDAQLEQLKAAGCAKVYREKATGAQVERRELQRMLKAMAPGDVVTVTRIDRLARSTFDLFSIVKQIADAGGQFRSLAEPWADSSTQHRALNAGRARRAGRRRARPYQDTHGRGQEPRHCARAAHGPTIRPDRPAGHRGPPEAAGRSDAARAGRQLQRQQGDDFEAGRMSGPATDEQSMIPDAPKFSDAEMQRCRDTGDYKPVLFQWYKFVGSLCFVAAFIRPDSPAYRAISPQHYYVLAGLLNRCARLMLSNVALSHEGKFGETTAIVDRCIFESAVQIIWLCHGASDEEFDRYLAGGLKTELEFKARIQANVAANGGISSPIEARMLKSIARHIDASGLAVDSIKAAKKQRDLAAMIDGLGFDRLLYIVAQKIGSHHIHGTWSSLLFHYLEKRDDAGAFAFGPSAPSCDTHINQFMFVPRIVLHAMRGFVRHTLEGDEADALCGLFDSTEEEIMRVYAEAGDDAR